MLVEVLESIDALLIDLDGVLYVEEEPVAGAMEAVERLRGRGLALRFVTNTTAYSRDRTLRKLARLGLRVASRELVTPAALAVQRCHERGHGRVALIMNEEVKQDFAELQETTDRADAVIMGDLGPAFGYDVLNHAFRQVMDGAELIALQKNRYWMRADIRVSPAAAAMVGDDIESDIGGALRAGLAAILVRTGKYREEQARESGVEPTKVVDSIADVPQLLGC